MHAPKTFRVLFNHFKTANATPAIRRKAFSPKESFVDGLSRELSCVDDVGMLMI